MRANTMNDYYTKRGAEALAARIRAFWAGGNKTQSVWVEPLTFMQDAKREAESEPRQVTLYVVKSNMVGGLPV